MQVSIKEIVSYKGHSVKANGNIDITFSAMFDQLTNSIEILQLLNSDTKITAKLAGAKPISLGVFTLKSLSINANGESTIKFVSLTDYVEIDNLNEIIAQENFQVRMEGKIETEDEKE